MPDTVHEDLIWDDTKTQDTCNRSSLTLRRRDIISPYKYTRARVIGFAPCLRHISPLHILPDPCGVEYTTAHPKDRSTILCIQTP